MRYWDQRHELGARVCAQLQMKVSPDASAGIARAYPVGAPVLLTVCTDPCAATRDDAAHYVLRQPFVAEIPIVVRAGVCAGRASVRLKGEGAVLIVKRRFMKHGMCEYGGLFSGAC